MLSGPLSIPTVSAGTKASSGRTSDPLTQNLSCDAYASFTAFPHGQTDYSPLLRLHLVAVHTVSVRHLLSLTSALILPHRTFFGALSTDACLRDTLMRGRLRPDMHRPKPSPRLTVRAV